jgi:hypothetical protein
MDQKAPADKFQYLISGEINLEEKSMIFRMDQNALHLCSRVNVSNVFMQINGFQRVWVRFMRKTPGMKLCTQGSEI